MSFERLEMPDADVVYFRNFFSPVISDFYLQTLIEKISWRQESIKIFGREIPQPRLTAWYGDENAVYIYSGIKNHPLPWIPELIEIKEKCEAVAAAEFNSVLLNYYRHGQDSMGWHQDNEPELGPDPIIASVNFGATRQFDFKHKKRKDLNKISLFLEHGSLLLMHGETQNYWKHQLPKTSRPISERINLTFRKIIPLTQ